jgi:alpha-galactosidase/6-phospho-beta-glucosidase family protein
MSKEEQGDGRKAGHEDRTRHGRWLKVWQDETRQVWQWQRWQTRQSRVRQGGQEEREKYKRREERRQKTATIPDSYLPRSRSSRYTQRISFYPLHTLLLEFATSANIDLAAQSS